MDIIQIKRGLFSSMPSLSSGELGFCTDTKELYIGSPSGNLKIACADFFDILTAISSSLESHESDTYAHRNLIIDGNAH